MAIFALDREYRCLAWNDSHRQMMLTAWNVEPQLGRSLLADVIGSDEVWAQAKAQLDRALLGERFARLTSRQRSFAGADVRKSPRAADQMIRAKSGVAWAGAM